MKKIESLHLILLKDRRDQFAHGWSFFKNQQERFDHGQSFFELKKTKDRRSKDQKIEFPNPANWYYDQGGEFDHRFFDRMDRFLWSKDWFNSMAPQRFSHIRISYVKSKLQVFCENTLAYEYGTQMDYSRNMRKTKLVKQIFNIRNVLVSFFLTILFLCKASQNPQKS